MVGNRIRPGVSWTGFSYAVAACALASCGGKTELETHEVLLPEPIGGFANGGTGGSGLGSSTHPSGGVSYGGKANPTGGHAATAGTDVIGGQVGRGGAGGLGGGSPGGRGTTTGGSTLGGKGGLGGTSFGGRGTATGGSTLGGKGGLGGTSLGGGAAVAGFTSIKSCPDELSDQSDPPSMSGSLLNYQDSYTPSCNRYAGGAEFTFAWYVPAADTYVIDTLGSATDTTLAAYGGLCGENELACNDDDAYGTSRQSRIVVEISEPQFVTVVVGGYQGSTGDFTLKLHRATDLIQSILPQTLPITVDGDTRGLADTSTSLCGSRVSSSDFTYLFRAPTAGTYSFSLSWSNFDSILYLRENGPAGKEFSCNFNSPGVNPSLSYFMTAGQAVAVIVDGFQASSGQYELSVARSNTDSGSCCSTGGNRVGCADSSVAACVCAMRPSCCRSLWDDACVDDVTAFGCGFCSSM